MIIFIYMIRASWRVSLFGGESGIILLIIFCIKSETLLGNIFEGSSQFFLGGDNPQKRASRKPLWYLFIWYDIFICHNIYFKAIYIFPLKAVLWRDILNPHDLRFDTNNLGWLFSGLLAVLCLLFLLWIGRVDLRYHIDSYWRQRFNLFPNIDVPGNTSFGTPQAGTGTPVFGTPSAAPTGFGQSGTASGGQGSFTVGSGNTLPRPRTMVRAARRRTPKR